MLEGSIDPKIRVSRRSRPTRMAAKNAKVTRLRLPNSTQRSSVDIASPLLESEGLCQYNAYPLP